MEKDYYKILGVHPEASEEDIKEAYRIKAQKYHPDKDGGNSHRFKEMKEAHDILSDPIKRAAYNKNYFNSKSEYPDSSTKHQGTAHIPENFNGTNYLLPQKAFIVSSICAFLLLVLVVVAIANSSPNSTPTTNITTVPNLSNDDPLGLFSDNNQEYSFNLPLTVLETEDCEAGNSMFADKYPTSISISSTTAIDNQVAAYGAAYGSWVAPKDWTGSGGEGCDGTSSATLYPKTEDGHGSVITYTSIPACVGCMTESAAPYFSNALSDYNQYLNKDYSDNITIPTGLEVTPISPTLITYTLPDSNGYSTSGVVYYNPTNQTGLRKNDPGNLTFNPNSPYYQAPTSIPYMEAKFVLPTGENDLSDFLAKNFISQEGLK